MAEIVTLKIGGQAFSAWEEVLITRSMGDLSAAFALTLYDAPAIAARTSVITEQAACELWIGKQLLITGYINVVEQTLTETSHSLRVTGRDKAGDLIDCSAVHRTGQWKGQALEAIARDLASPFGLKVRVEASTGPAFALFALEHGETAADALTRLTRMRGLMLRVTPEADIVIYDPSAARQRLAPVVLGRDLTSLRTTSSSAERFSDYIVKGQHRGGNDVSADDAAGARGQAGDATIQRYRPKIIISDEQSTRAGCQLRAEWEATTRFGNAVSATATVMGWRDAAGRLIEPNLILPLAADYLGLNEDLIVCDVAMSLSSNGTAASLRLVRPEAYTTAEILELRSKKGKVARIAGGGGQNWLGALS